MISAKYKKLYLSTSLQQMEEFSKLLLEIEQKPGTRDMVEDLFRLIHSMKGAAATMGFKSTVVVFHSLEDLIQASYHNDFIVNKNVLDVFFETLKLLKKNFSLIEKGNKEYNFAEHIKKLNKAIKTQNKFKKVKRAVTRREKRDFLDDLNYSTEIAVPAESLNSIQNSFDDLMISVMKIKSIVKHLDDTELLAASMQSDKLINNITKQLQDLRVIPLSQIFNPLNYLVREIAKEENKKVQLCVNHNNISLDKSVLDELVEILIQLIRNAIVHGISTRQRKGAIHLEARLADDKINIIVRDNGRGIDWQYIMDTAIKRKIISPTKAKSMTLDDIKQLIFTSGISSSTEISTRSGRGIGLAVVRNKINELGGAINVDSSKNNGATFSIDVPLPFSMFRTLNFKFADYCFAIPLSYIDEIISLDKKFDGQNTKYYRHKRSKYHLISFANIFSVKDFAATYKYMALLDYHGSKLAIPVHSNVEEGSVVAKKMPQVLKNKKYIKGVAVGDDGRPVLILNLEDLI